MIYDTNPLIQLENLPSQFRYSLQQNSPLSTYTLTGDLYLNLPGDITYDLNLSYIQVIFMRVPSDILPGQRTIPVEISRVLRNFTNIETDAPWLINTLSENISLPPETMFINILGRIYLSNGYFYTVRKRLNIPESTKTINTYFNISNT